MAYQGGLRQWFKDDWRDIKTGEKCGRSSAEKSKRGYPACRPKKVADRMSKSEKASASRQKTGPKRYSGYSITAGGRRRLKINKRK